MQSYPLRVRGLKPDFAPYGDGVLMSYPLRVRGLKLMSSIQLSLNTCRILYGYVD